MDIVPILPGQPHPSILHILSEGSIQLLGGGGGGGGGGGEVSSYWQLRCVWFYHCGHTI